MTTPKVQYSPKAVRSMRKDLTDSTSRCSQLPCKMYCTDLNLSDSLPVSVTIINHKPTTLLFNCPLYYSPSLSGHDATILGLYQAPMVSSVLGPSSWRLACLRAVAPPRRLASDRSYHSFNSLITTSSKLKRSYHQIGKSSLILPYHHHGNPIFFASRSGDTFSNLRYFSQATQRARRSKPDSVTNHDVSHQLQTCRMPEI